jgi:hypothetical protein
MRRQKQPYAGIDKDTDGGMTVAGCIIREQYLRIQRAAFDNARKAGWDAGLMNDD